MVENEESVKFFNPDKSTTRPTNTSRQKKTNRAKNVSTKNNFNISTKFTEYEATELELQKIITNLNVNKPKQMLTLPEIRFKMNRENSELSLIDYIINKSGYGYVQWISIWVAAGVLGFEGIQLPFTSLMLIPLNEYYNMTDIQTEFSSAIIFIGVGIGSFMLSYMTNWIGRLTTMNIFSVLALFFTFISCFCTSYYLYLVIRVIIGVTLGVLEPLVLSTLVEFLPIKYRAFVLTIIFAGGATGTATLYLAIVVFLPNYSIKNIQIVFIVIFFYSLVIVAINLFFYEDSPRHLILQNKSKKAFYLIEQMTERKLSPDLKKEIQMQTIDMASYVRRTSGLGFLFHEKNFMTSVCLIVIWTSTTLALYGPMQISSLALVQLGYDQDSSTIVLVQFVSAVLLFVSIILGSFLCEVPLFGRRLSMLLSWLLSFIASLFIWFYPLSLPYIMCILGLTFGIGNNVVCTYTSEFYHTKERDYALGFFFMVSRVSGFISQFIFLLTLKIDILFPFYILSAIYFVMTVFTFLLPYETFGKPIDEEWMPESIIDRLTRKHTKEEMLNMM